jgi:uncharacterized SAM-binding protein YcdF (DUF218 family)
MDTVIFIISKVVGAFLRPDTWIILVLAMSMLALVRGRQRVAAVLGLGLLCATITLAILPIGSLLLQPIERSFPNNPPLDAVDGVIILGGGENARASAYWEQMQLNEGGDRFAAGVILAQRFPNAKILFAGGSGLLRDVRGNLVSEASVAEAFLLDQGLAADRLLLEGRSRNTTENARLSLELVRPVPSETWVLVTSAFHMPRAMRSFEAAGWPKLIAWPVDYRTSRFSDEIGWDLTGHLQTLSTAIREWVGIVAYRVMGR